MNRLEMELSARQATTQPSMRLVSLASDLITVLNLGNSALTDVLSPDVPSGLPEEMLACWLSNNGINPYTRDGLMLLPLLVAHLLNRLESASSELLKEIHHAAH